LRYAILAEFGGRCPSVLEVVNIPSIQWTSVPGIGMATLREFRRILGDMPGKIRSRSLAGSTDAELLSEYVRLNSELHRLKRELRDLQPGIRAVAAELRVRGVTLQRKRLYRRRGSIELKA